MTTPATHALAPAFTHTSVPPDVVLNFVSGTSPVNVNIPTGTYRMALAPSASDFLRVIAAAINVASAGAGHTDDVVSLTVRADGVAVFTFLGGVDTECDGVDFSAAIRKRLGFSGVLAPPIDNSYVVTGDYPVWGLALLSCATGAYWQPRQPGGAEVDGAGRVYTFASSITAWSRKLKVEYQPTTPAMKAAHATDATALYPAEAYMGALGSTATAREWSVLDVLYASRNALCGYTSTWGTARTSTTEPIWRAYVAPATLLSLTTELHRAEWLAYSTWSLELSADASTPTETRA